MSDDDLDLVGDDRLVLGDLLNHVLDKGIVISGDVTIAVADIDLIRVGLGVYITAIQSELDHAAARERTTPDADVPVLRHPRGL
ncbi:MAG TPA: gas vesicle protein [Gemmatimonadaceae bacterium]|nr:gas vesicle protein [Gemmatimonadaceae bacterium]